MRLSTEINDWIEMKSFFEGIELAYNYYNEIWENLIVKYPSSNLQCEFYYKMWGENRKKGKFILPLSHFIPF